MRWPLVARWRWVDALEGCVAATRHAQSVEKLFFEVQQDYTKRIGKLEDQLLNYGEHLNPCDAFEDESCTCGWVEVRDAVSPF